MPHDETIIDLSKTIAALDAALLKERNTLMTKLNHIISLERDNAVQVSNLKIMQDKLKHAQATWGAEPTEQGRKFDAIIEGKPAEHPTFFMDDIAEAMYLAKQTTHLNLPLIAAYQKRRRSAALKLPKS